MRSFVSAILATFVCLPLLAQAAGLRIEYGKPIELAKAKSVYLSTADDPDLRVELQRQLSEALPALTYADSEAGADVFIRAVRKAESEQKEAAMVTTVAVARQLPGGTVRLYVDGISRQNVLSDAVREVLAPVVLLFQQANSDIHGRPDADAVAKADGKAKVHSTAGLHPGLTKREVFNAVGMPTRVSKGSNSDVWSYETSDGTMRLVFRGDLVMSITLTPKK